MKMILTLTEVEEMTTQKLQNLIHGTSIGLGIHEPDHSDGESFVYV